MELGLAGKAIVITGGTDGLGLALADRLVEEGAHVAVCARDPERLSAHEARWRAAGAEPLCVRADVTQLADLERLVGAVADRWGQIDGVVNNAAKSSGHPFESIPDDEWAIDFGLKVHAAARLVRLALPLMRAAGGGSIVNVLNVGAKAPPARSLPTTASRAAGLAMTKALSKEYGGEGIRVNAVLIGLIESGQWRRLAAQRGVPVEDVYAGMAAGIPLGRVGRAHEFADLATYLLSERSSYVTGSAINLDGGSGDAL